MWIAADPRWVAVHLMLQVEMIMLGLIVLAAVRARSELDYGRPLTWLFLVGSTGLLISSAVLWLTHTRRPAPSRPGTDSRKTAGHQPSAG